MGGSANEETKTTGTVASSTRHPVQDGVASLTSSICGMTSLPGEEVTQLVREEKGNHSTVHELALTSNCRED